MKAPRDLSFSNNKRTLTFAILSLSTIIILGTSAYAYSHVSYQTPLNVAGSNTGLTPSTGMTFSLLMVVIPLVLGTSVSLSLFITLRFASKHVHKVPSKANATTSEPVSGSPPLPAPESDTQSYSASTQPEEALLEPPSNSGLGSIDRILQSLHQQGEEAGENSENASHGSSQ
jgi:hypothetical protein